MASYSASKVSLLFLGEALAMELDKNIIKILNVCPAGMETNFQKNNDVKKNENEKLLSTDYVANKIFSNLKKDKITVVISVNALLMYYFSKFMPKKYYYTFKILMSKMR